MLFNKKISMLYYLPNCLSTQQKSTHSNKKYAYVTTLIMYDVWKDIYLKEKCIHVRIISIM